MDVLAETGSRFSGFAPYVPSINQQGLVAFQAGLRDGRTGVFVGDGRSVHDIADSAVDEVHAYRSHPAFNDAGDLSVYAELRTGGNALVARRSGRWESIAAPGAELAAVGPLGPTMNAAGAIAFRAQTVAGHDGVFLACDETIASVADTRGVFAAFHGLPIVTDDGSVLFRADLRRGGGHGIFLSTDGAILPIAENRDPFAELGFFPSAARNGTIAFVASLQSGGAGVFTSFQGQIKREIDQQSGFTTFRGALVDDRGRIVFHAVPEGGALGTYALHGDVAKRITGIGDHLFGSIVTEFALNPVSMNGSGHIGLRITLADARQLIVRVDPFG